jgi:hypothetical protein
MIYQTTDIHYVEIVNPMAHYHATQIATLSDCWQSRQRKDREARAWENLQLVKDRKLTVPLEEFDALWRKRAL